MRAPTRPGPRVAATASNRALAVAAWLSPPAARSTGRKAFNVARTAARPAMSALHLRRNRFGAAGAAALADALLAEGEPRAWPSLDLAYNPLGDDGCAAVARLATEDG